MASQDNEPMHVAYSALNGKTQFQTKTGGQRLIRYRAYQAACIKHGQHIAAIQKYIPGWMPEFK